MDGRVNILIYLFMANIRLISLFIFFLIPFNTYASINEYKLENGLKVIVVEDKKSPLAVFQIWYRVGSRDEPIGKTGISHFLEHMMFKGTPKYGKNQFSNIIQKNGGIDNAFTTKDYTMYFQTLSSDRIGISINLESDRMTNILLDPKEVESERGVIMEERRLRYEDDPQNLLYESVIATAFKAHPYRWPIIGWMSDIENISRDDLYNHYKQYYSPENSFIIVSGDVDAEKIFNEIKEKFGNIPKGDKSNNHSRPNKFSEPPQRGEKRIYVKKEAELPYLLISYHVPPFPHEDSFALEVMSMILSAGKSSRLYRNIVDEKKLALDIFADYSGLNIDPFVFLFGSTSMPGINIEDVEKAIYDEIKNLQNNPPSEIEVQKAKNQLESYFIFSQDSNYSKALHLGIFEILGDWRLIDKYIEGIRKVTPADVQEVAKKYFSDDKKTVGILVPINKEVSKNAL